MAAYSPSLIYVCLSTGGKTWCVAVLDQRISATKKHFPYYLMFDFFSLPMISSVVLVSLTYCYIYALENEEHYSSKPLQIL